MSKAQISIELMVMIAAILVIFIPLLLSVYFKTNESNEQLFQVQSELMSTRLSNLINAVGNLGQNSSLRAEIFVPNNVKLIELNNLGRGGEVLVKISTSSGDTDIVDIVKFPVTPLKIDKPSQGLRRFDISYDGQKVNVKVV